jgi:hypothetical protein
VRWGVSPEELREIINGKNEIDAEQAILEYMRAHEPLFKRPKTIKLDCDCRRKWQAYGYNPDGTVNQKEIKMAKWMIDRRKKNIPCRVVADELNAMGSTNRSGRPWTSNNVNHISRSVAERLGISI